MNAEHFKIVFSTVDSIEQDRAALIDHLPLHRDRSGQLHRNIHIAPDHDHGGIAIVNRQGAVEFRVTGIPGEDPLRRLAEKHALGVIDYRPISEGLLTVFHEGGELPDLSVEPVSAAALRVPAFQAGRTLVLFASSCAPCVLNEYMAELGALKTRMSANGDDSRLAAVFDTSFDPKLVADQLEDARMPSLVYRANLRQLVTSSYETRTDALAVPLVIKMDTDEKILFAQAFRVF